MHNRDLSQVEGISEVERAGYKASHLSFLVLSGCNSLRRGDLERRSTRARRGFRIAKDVRGGCFQEAGSSRVM